MLKHFLEITWLGCLLVVLLLTPLEGNPPALERFEFHRLQMGTLFRVVLYAGEPSHASQAAGAAFDRIEQLEQILSDFREDSELSQAERQAFERPVTIGHDLFLVLERAVNYARLTDGAFDPTVKPLINLWRAAKNSGQLPSAARLAAARKRVGFQKILLNHRMRSLRFRIPHIELDLGGIGKGYAADEALKVIQKLGTSQVLVDAGGDIRVGSAPPGRSAWLIDLDDHGGEKLSLRLVDRAVATSGDAYQYTAIGGVRYSHIVDPRTGMGLERQSEVTVTAPTALVADVLATSFSVLEPQEALKLAGTLEGVEVWISESDVKAGKAQVSKHFPP